MLCSKRLKLFCLLSVALLVTAFFWCSYRRQQQAEQRHHLTHALVIAITDNDVSTVRALLDSGADANAPDDAPIAWSVWGVRISRSPSEVFNGGTPPLVLAAMSSPRSAQWLLAHGADINARDVQGNMALADAVQSGDTGLAQVLLNAGANPNGRDGRGDSLLSSAVQSGSRNTVRLLLAKGADPDAANIGGWTALAGAAGRGDLATVRLLLARGADPNALGSPVGGRPILAAARTDNLEMVKLLLKHGASVYPPDMAGQPVWAKEDPGLQVEVRKLLQAAGAKT